MIPMPVCECVKEKADPNHLNHLPGVLVPFYNFAPYKDGLLGSMILNFVVPLDSDSFIASALSTHFRIQTLF
jgi:hypothetical protein